MAIITYRKLDDGMGTTSVTDEVQAGRVTYRETWTTDDDRRMYAMLSARDKSPLQTAVKVVGFAAGALLAAKAFRTLID